MGATVGGLYAALNRAGMRKFWRSPGTQLNVVITGGGKGIGKAIAREFLRSVNASMLVLSVGVCGLHANICVCALLPSIRRICCKMVPYTDAHVGKHCMQFVQSS